MKFGCSKSVLWTSVHRVVDAILDVNNDKKIITWPTAQQASDVVNAFSANCGFPGEIKWQFIRHNNAQTLYCFPRHNVNGLNTETAALD